MTYLQIFLVEEALTSWKEITKSHDLQHQDCKCKKHLTERDGSAHVVGIGNM